MNEFLDKQWIERVSRLALGLEPIDAERGTRLAHPIRVLFDAEARGLRRPKVERHDSCLHALLYQPGVADRVTLRFLEISPMLDAGRARFPDYPRRLVPRRISYPILAVKDAEKISYRNRVRRPALFPGAAYDADSGVTGLRGRVERGEKLVRWARITATLVGNGTVVGRAHGDDRGEFLLLISSQASSVGDLQASLDLRVEIAGPDVDPVPEPPGLPSLDRFWDLPEEKAETLDPAHPEIDQVSAAEDLPTGYSLQASKTIAFTLGQIRSETEPFKIT